MCNNYDGYNDKGNLQSDNHVRKRNGKIHYNDIEIRSTKMPIEFCAHIKNNNKI